MLPDERAATNGRPPSVAGEPNSASELDGLRATCRSQASIIDRLSEAVSSLCTRAAALKAENVELRVHNDRLRRGRRPSSIVIDRADDRAMTSVRLPMDTRAPGAARLVVAESLRRRAPAGVIDTAQLLVSELVTNSVLHSRVPPGQSVAIRIRLAPGTCRVEVEDPGSSGFIAPRAPDLERGGGFGLNLVQSLSERWGLERATIGPTRVWAQFAREPPD